MKNIFLSLALIFTLPVILLSQNEQLNIKPKHGVIWSAGLFKSWLKDDYVGFHQIEDKVIPIFSEKYKMGFSIHSHYMYKVNHLISTGIHLGLGLDVNSFPEAPLVLFGGSIAHGKNQDFILTIGWSDGKRRKVTSFLREELTDVPLTSTPIIEEETELNTGFYLGLSYKLW